MNADAPGAASIDALSREFSLACDSDGVITWCDGRCRAVLGIGCGESLASLAAPGTHGKMRALLEQGMAGPTWEWEVALVLQERPVTVSFNAMPAEAGPTWEWEVALVLQGRPVTVSFNAMPAEAGLLLVGHIAPENYLRALAQLSESMQEVMSLNREVVNARKELQRRHDDVLRLHQELTEAHQGVLAMHGELEDRATELARTVQVKTRIVADLGHELRTPVHAILVLARLLADGDDGPLRDEQSKQVNYIRKAAEELLNLVDDLLDLSAAEFGKSILRVEKFSLPDFAAAVRGMLRPLVPADSKVALEFEPAPDVALETDRAKLGQVVRNLVSNALKFTEAGEVRVRFSGSTEGTVDIAVVDTGIGIAPEHHEIVFEEFAQLDTPLHERVRGSGLGLALSRRLARRLGGDVRVESAPGEGSTFTLSVPAHHPEARKVRELEANAQARAPAHAPVLVVEDDYQALLEYGRVFAANGLHLVAARSIAAAREAIAREAPAAILLDVMLEGEASWAFLKWLKSDAATREIPVIVATVTNREHKARSLGADEFWVKPLDATLLVARLKELARLPDRADAGA